jgi:hypothetical protein
MGPFPPLTSQIDQALDTPGDDDSGAAAVAAGRQRLAGGDDWFKVRTRAGGPRRTDALTPDRGVLNSKE